MEKLANDVLWGAKAIADEIGWPVRRIYHAAEKHHLPIDKVGGVLVSTKSRLRRRLSGEAD